MDEILKYFPNLTDIQIEQFQKLEVLYHDWNAKINVISRKDIDELYTKHVLHSLGIAKIVKFEPGSYSFRCWNWWWFSWNSVSDSFSRNSFLFD